ERKVHVDEAHEHRERAEQERHGLVTEPRQRAVDGFRKRRIGSENDHPGVDADQKVAPERQNDEQQEESPKALRSLGDQRRERIREREAEERSEQRVPYRLEEDLGVDRLA